MSRGNRKRVQPRVLDELERRRLLAAPVVPGNLGQVLASQFQPYGFKTLVGSQLQGVKLGGPFQVDVVSPTTSSTGQTSTSPINSGLIKRSQFNGGGFRTVGLQFQHVKIGGGLTVTGSDNDDAATSSSGVTAAAGGIFAGLTTLVNKNLITNSQVSDGGFGVLDRAANGDVIAREGRVGLQWRNTKVGGPVDIGLDDLIIRPATATTAATASSVAATAIPGTTVIDPTTNTGQIRDSQFNDGGFGDIGMQWTQVAVGGRVATSTNTLFIEPQQDGGGPITLQNQTFGQRTSATATAASAGTVAATSAHQSALVRSAATIPSTETNAATNSGRIVGAQVNDGGFGDVGLQWKKVRVRGDVTAVHNSLTVQPENAGQGLITVQGIQFPTTPAATPPTAHKTLQTLPTDPAVVASDGNPVTGNLATPTGPLSPFFSTPIAGVGTVTLPFPGNLPLVNAATNSGLVRGGQFNAGGFGDEGLQWQNVRVGGGVQIVHNSLSVHPEGSGLAGITVDNVAYGSAVSAQVARHLAVLPSAVISTGSDSDSDSLVSASATSGGKVLHPPNDRQLANQQLAAANSTDVFLQWNGIVHNRGLVLVHNIIKIMGVGESTGPITLSNIRFPFRVPTLATLSIASVQAAAATSTTSPDPVLLNSANNSGILSHTQFSDGGFGDEGLQWKNSQIGGSVEVVHNTLAVDATADLPTGDVAGPIAISNVTFNSGALEGDLSTRHTQLLVSPPDVYQRVSSHPANFGKALPHDSAVVNNATNSGILTNGQLAAGGTNHALLQWQGVRTRGPVKVIDNVLAISVLDRPAEPITISNVTFA